MIYNKYYKSKVVLITVTSKNFNEITHSILDGH